MYFKDATHSAGEDKVTLMTTCARVSNIRWLIIPGATRVMADAAESTHEARLLYVAMTRATCELVLCGAEA